MKVFCYYNLHKRTWSVKALEGKRKGRVICHSDYVILSDACGKVSEAGRLRVLKEKRKNVHAGIVGHLIDGDDYDRLSEVESGELLYYNPYKVDRFVFKESGEEFVWGKHVVMDAREGKNEVRVL